MAEESPMRFRDKFMWHPDVLKFTMACPTVLALILALALYLCQGTYSITLILVAGMGFLFLAIFGFVGWKVAALRKKIAHEPGEKSDCLMVNGTIQSPGIAVLRDKELLLIPIVGKAVTLPFSDILSIQKSSCFNGKLLIFKKGLWLEVPDKKRMGFAVPTRLAERWTDRIMGDKTG